MSSKTTTQQVPGTADDSVEALRRQLASQGERLRQLESLLEEELSEKQRGHINAKRLDARVKLNRGSIKRAVIITAPADNDGETAVCRLDKIITFVHPNGLSLRTGDTLRVKINDVGESHAEAIALEKCEEGIGQ